MWIILRHSLSLAGAMARCYQSILRCINITHRCFPTTDFPFIAYCRSLFASGFPVIFNPDAAFLTARSIRFGYNHDLALNDRNAMQGLLFANESETILANCLAQLYRGGTTLTYAPDFHASPALQMAISMRAKNQCLVGPCQITRKPGLLGIAGSE